jgi:hypothetical protein
MYGASLTPQELQQLSLALKLPLSLIQKENDAIFSHLKSFKNPTEDLWARFSQEFRHRGFFFSDLYRIQWDLDVADISKSYWYEEIKWKRVGNWLAIYDGSRFVALSRKIFLCHPQPLQAGERVVGHWIHRESFVERGFHFCAGDFEGHSISILQEGEDLWLRGQVPFLTADVRQGLVEDEKSFATTQAILNYFEVSNPQEAVILHSDFFQLQNPRPIILDRGVYNIHPWHLPCTHQIWVMMELAIRSLLRHG